VIPCRPDKKPYLAWTEYQKRRASADEIRAWFTKWPHAMIAIVTGEISRLFVVDCDTLEGYEAIQKLLPESLITPIARTPRGGWHLWFIYPGGSKITVAAGFLPGCDYRGEGGYVCVPPSRNGEGGGYRWMDGLSIEEVEPPPMPDGLYKSLYFSLYALRREAENGQGVTGRYETLRDVTIKLTEGHRDDAIFHIANTLIKGGENEANATYLLKLIADKCSPPFPEKEIPIKIQSAIHRARQRERNFQDEVESWVSVTEGYWNVTECNQALQNVTKEARTAVRVAIHRLYKAGVIERHGNKNGCYRRIDRNIEFMDFANADIGNTIDLSLPLGLHIKTKLFPKGVIVVAGVSGMGKTLFCFNTIAENMGQFPIFYFNSEMGPEALKQKLSHFPIPMSEWQKAMKVIDHWDFNNIPDKIQPDAFNVVDYLEPEGDRPYNIHGVISAIIRRLNKGTALITIQKKPNTTMGTGGIYSIKAATLAVALDWGKIEVVKNRFREADQMPSLNKINFEIHQGYKFVKQGGWYR
jgi:hypothetical protein